MVISSRFLSYRIWQNLHLVKTISKEARASSSSAEALILKTKSDSDSKNETTQESIDSSTLAKYRFSYPEFLPDPNPLYRNSVREKLERLDMLARRSVVSIPEFYVGSILAVTYAEPHAIGKVNKFVGICIERGGCGLRAYFILRNVVDNEGIEVRYELYDPAVQNVQCLRLEKRLDDKLLYLRDADPKYSTFPFDMEPEPFPDGAPVPLNEIKVPLKQQKWIQRYELQNLKGATDIIVTEKRRKKAEKLAKPWEEYDLMKAYRETIPKEEQEQIFSELQMELSQLEVKKNILKRKRAFTRPKKSV